MTTSTTTLTPPTGPTGPTGSTGQPSSAAPERKRARRHPAVFIALLIIAIALLLPFLALLLTALKSPQQLSSAEFIWFPIPPAIENFAQAVTEQPFLVYATN
jgi:multiple sugar transport system permease protein